MTEDGFYFGTRGFFFFLLSILQERENEKGRMGLKNKTANRIEVVVVAFALSAVPGSLSVKNRKKGKEINALLYLIVLRGSPGILRGKPALVELSVMETLGQEC